MQLLEYRKQAQKTQKELASAVGITQGYLSLLESGDKKNPSITLLQRIAKELGITVNDLISNEKAG